jgi:hypothetical protein
MMGAEKESSDRGMNSVATLLSSQTKSWCTYIFRTTSSLDHVGILSSLEEQVGKDHAQAFYIDPVSLVIRISHQLVDAQRGLALAVDALKNAPSITPPNLPLLSAAGSLDEWSEQTFDLASIKAQLMDQTLTQWTLQRLVKQHMAGRSDSDAPGWRVIVSSQKSVPTHANERGNHFVPVDLSTSQAMTATSRSAAQWKKLLMKLAGTASKSIENLHYLDGSSERHLSDRITLTSVGSLSTIEQTLRLRGITSMTMFPERVSWCSSVVTIYSLFGRLHVVLSGRNRLDSQIFDAFQTCESEHPGDPL